MPLNSAGLLNPYTAAVLLKCYFFENKDDNHGSRHASRVATLIPALYELLENQTDVRFLGDLQQALGFQSIESLIRALQITALLHDSGHGYGQSQYSYNTSYKEKNAVWERLSVNNIKVLFNQMSIPSNLSQGESLQNFRLFNHESSINQQKMAAVFAAIIEHKNDQGEFDKALKQLQLNDRALIGACILRNILAAADCIEVVRVRDSFDPTILKKELLQAKGQSTVYVRNDAQLNQALDELVYANTMRINDDGQLTAQRGSCTIYRLGGGSQYSIPSTQNHEPNPSRENNRQVFEQMFTTHMTNLAKYQQNANLPGHANILGKPR